MTRSVFGLFLSVFLTVPLRPLSAEERADIVVADFEQETYGAWQTTGEAFGTGPAAGTLPGQMRVDGFEGKRLVNSFAKGDRSTGTLTSPPFTIERRWINFLIGGGAHSQTRIELVVDGQAVRTASGPNDRPGGSERLDWHAWDVSGLAEKSVTIRIVDEHQGGWGHINIDQILQSDRKRMAEPVRWELAIERKYVWLPVQNGAPKQRMTFRVGERIVREFEIELALDRTDFHVFADVTSFAGKTLVIESLRRSGDGRPGIEQHDELPAAESLYREPLRPQFHFTSRRGWLNDPNGLVWKDGEYHLYYQHNPYGHEWGNMHWGHAVSPDLLHWRELPIALYPHKFGDWAFSGSAVFDSRNDSGFGRPDQPPLVGAYTSTGRGECILFSLDQGRTWTEFEGSPVFKHAGRDPRLLWHAASKQWVMALYDEFDGKKWISFHTSPDLKLWSFASRIEGFYECPDIVQLAIDGREKETRWVLYGADGQYLVGDFDGTMFRPDGDASKKHRLWHGNFYAAQTFSRTPDDRVIQIGWGSGIGFPGMPFNQQMAIPVELTLRKTDEGLRMCAVPVRELKSLEEGAESRRAVRLAEGKPLAFQSAATEIRLELRSVRLPASGKLKLSVGGEPVVCDGETKTLQVRDNTLPLTLESGTFDLDLLIDRRSIEVFVSEGRVALSRERTTSPLKNTELNAVGTEPVEIGELQISSLKSVWPEPAVSVPGEAR